MPRPTLTVNINGLVPNIIADHASIPPFAADLERWGIDQIVLGEHLLQSPVVVHPGAEVDLMTPMPEPLMVLASAAACTRQLRFTTGAVIAGLRSAIPLAKVSATLDALSAGRFALGLTAGWWEPEFAAIGVPFEERFARLDELIDVCRSLWGPQPASFTGRWTSFDRMYSTPTPIAGASMPIWFGGRASAATARRVAKCQGWILSEAAGLDEIPRGMALIADACGARGSDASAIGVRATVPRSVGGLATSAARGTPPITAVVEHAWRGLVERVAIGVTDVCLPLPEWCRDRETAELIVRAIVQRVDETYGSQRDS